MVETIEQEQTVPQLHGQPKAAHDSWKVWLTAAMTLLVAIDGFFLIQALPVSNQDEPVYKGLAYMLAVHGKWAVPFYQGVVPGIEQFFGSGYPPLFMLGLAGWFKLFGFGVYQSHAYSMVIHLGGAALGGTLAAHLVDENKRFWSVVACLAVFSYMRLDRPDLLASLLALATVVLLFRSLEPSSKKCAGIGLCFAASLLVQPAATLLYGILLGMLLLQLFSFRRSFWLIGIVAATVFVAVEGTLFLLSPQGFEYFLGLSAKSNLWSRGADASWLPRLPNEAWPWLAWFALYLVAGLWIKRHQPSRGVWMLWVSTTASFLTWALLTEHITNYLMFLFPLAVVVGCAALCRLSTTGLLKKMAMAAAVGLLVISWIPIPVNLVRAVMMQDQDSYEYAHAAIRETIPGGSVVTGDGGLWTLLVNDYEYYIFTSGSHLAQAQYVVSQGTGAGRPGVSFFDMGYESLIGREFRLVFDGLIPERQRLIGIPIGRSRVGYGIRIYQRIAPANQTPGS
jgi:hypothetical protein